MVMLLSGSIQHKTVLDDPVTEMAACRTDILALCTFSTQTPMHTQTYCLRYPLLHPAEYSRANLLLNTREVIKLDRGVLNQSPVV